MTTYISALDPRINVAAPACYINTWRQLFTGPTGDSEQSFPDFLASGLDVMDYIEMFAPKPWLMANTVDDFFPIEGARYAYEEARRWYGIFGAEDKLDWAVGPGGHGTPLEIREAIYGWFIRWLQDGRGDAARRTRRHGARFRAARQRNRPGGRPRSIPAHSGGLPPARQPRHPRTDAGRVAEMDPGRHRARRRLTA